MAVKSVVLNRTLAQQFVNEVKAQYPKKAFGFFLSNERSGAPTEYIIMKEDQKDNMMDKFYDYGNYYLDHKDAGFLTSPEETVRVEKYIRNSHLHKVGVFHSHQRHPAILAKVDVDLHPSPEVWHLLISLRTVEYPQICIFSVDSAKRVGEVDIQYTS